MGALYYNTNNICIIHIFYRICVPFGVYVYIPPPLYPNAPPPATLQRCFFDSEKMTLLDFFDMYFVVSDRFS